MGRGSSTLNAAIEYHLGSFLIPSRHGQEVYVISRLTPCNHVDTTLNHPGEEGPPKWSLYRWHIISRICALLVSARAARRVC